MRDQYAGDISDYIKYAFLRALAGADRRLGVAWYYLEGNDGRPDGRHTEYLAEQPWSALDPTVYGQLRTLSTRSVAAIQRQSFWPLETRFHQEPVVSSGRDSWVEGMVNALTGTDLIFLDPDNGMGESGRKHARLADLVALSASGRALVTIKFPGRHATHARQVQMLHERLASAGLVDPLTISTCVRVPGRAGRVPRHRFFTIVGGDAVLHQRAHSFVGAFAQMPNASARVF